MRKSAGHFSRCGFHAGLLAALLLLVFPVAARAGQKNKKKSKTQDNASASPLVLPVPVSEQVDQTIGEMLGAFQIGDVEKMHKYYADNATFVSGTFAPPVVGWANYVPLYQHEVAAFQGMQLIRRNTYIFTHGDVAWASYQWEFLSSLNGQPYSAHGQTTLVLTKVGDNWLIVHNHTSEICPVCATAAPPPAQQQPQAQGPGNAPVPKP